MSIESDRGQPSANRKLWIWGLAILAALNAMWLFRLYNDGGENDEASDVSKRSQVENETLERSQLASGLRSRPMLRGSADCGMIGELVESEYHSARLPLAEWQTAAIEKLDDLMMAASDDSFIRDADYVDAGFEDYRQHVNTGEERRWTFIYHGEQLVQLGVLTRAQTEFVWYSYYSKLRVYLALRQVPFVQTHLGLTRQQLSLLNGLAIKGKVQFQELNLMPLDPEERATNAKAFIDINASIDADAVAILTPEQLQAWSALISEKPKPDVPSDIPELERRKNEAEKYLTLFIYINDNRESLKLTKRQEEQLRDLEEVVRTGIAVIRFRQEELEGTELPSEEQTKVDLIKTFVEHAEEIVFLAIFSQQQEQDVRKQLGMPGPKQIVSETQTPV